MKNSLKNRLKEEYENGVEIPSASLWDKLEEKLDATENSILITKKPPVNWWKYAAVVLCLITLGIIFKYNFKNDEEIQKPIITKVDTSEKASIKVETSLAEVENVEKPPKADKVFIETESTNIKSEKPQKYTSNTENFIKTKKQEVQNLEKFEEKKIAEVPNVEKSEIKNIAIIQNKVSTEKTIVKYVKADELLFARELQKNRENVAKNEKTNGFENSKFVKLITPSNIKILGITVYTEEQSN